MLILRPIFLHVLTIIHALGALACFIMAAGSAVSDDFREGLAVSGGSTIMVEFFGTETWLFLLFVGLVLSVLAYASWQVRPWAWHMTLIVYGIGVLGSLWQVSVNDYILLMHLDAPDAANASDSAAWGRYFTHLRESGSFDGGSAIGDGQSFRKSGQPAAGCEHLSGYIRVRCSSLEEAQAFLAGNPIYESGGTVEIRELPRS